MKFHIFMYAYVCLNPVTVFKLGLFKILNKIFVHIPQMLFVSNLRQVGGFLWVPWFSSTNKNDCHKIPEILLKVVLNTKTLTP